MASSWTSTTSNVARDWSPGVLLGVVSAVGLGVPLARERSNQDANGPIWQFSGEIRTFGGYVRPDVLISPNSCHLEGRSS